MDGLNIDDDVYEMSPSRAQQVIRDQSEKIHALEETAKKYRLLQREFENYKKETAYQVQSQENHGTEALIKELKEAKAEIIEKEHKLQYTEEMNNRLVFRMRSLQVEISGKENEISELKQEIDFMKRKLDKPVEILVNEIKQKDIYIERLKKRQHQNHTASIRIDELDQDRMSISSYSSYAPNYTDSNLSHPRYCHPRRRYIRQNHTSVQDSAEIVNEWNKILQIFQDCNDPNFFTRLKQYVILNISRLAMLGKNVDVQDEGVYSQDCYLCSKKFDCFHKPVVCSLCGYMYCSKCAPRSLLLGNTPTERKVCVLCEAMYKFIYKSEETK